LPGGICTHWKAPPLHGAHPNRTFLDLTAFGLPGHQSIDT